jgi:hypothetical protein
MNIPTTTAPPAALDPTAEALADVSLKIAIARAGVARGALVDLAPIAATVAMVCEQARAAAAGGGAVVADRLVRLEGELQALADDLAEAFARCTEPSALRSGTAG